MSTGVACSTYEENYYSFQNKKSYLFVSVITLVMRACIIVSAYLQTYWNPYNDPASFFKILMFNAKESDEKLFVEKPTLLLPKTKT
jgi:hypothetical protein